MQSFDGPWSKDLESFKKSVQSTPDQYKSSITSASKTTLDIICDPGSLHVWETDSDIDDLFQLTSVIAKLCDLGLRKEKGAKAQDGRMLILVEEKHNRKNFVRICQLVEYLIGEDGEKHLEGTVVAFRKIVIVRGWDNAIQDGQQEAMDKAIKRVNTSIERIFKMRNCVGDKKKIVWHHGPVLYFLLTWITKTSSTLRSALAGITITGALDLTTSIAPSTAGRANTLSTLERLETYAKRLDIPAVFLDATSQYITNNYLGTYMYFYAYYIHTLLPATLSHPHLYKAQDELVTFAFRLRAASEGRYGSAIVKQVQKHLDASQAKHWARSCISKDSYTKEKCRAAGREEIIHHAVHLADNPFARFNFTPSHSPQATSLHAFARLSIGPTSPTPSSHSLAIPVTLCYRTRQLRPTHPSPISILVPRPSQTHDKVTARIQGLMLAVLECVRQEHGNPVLGEREKHMWRAVGKACAWALDGSKGKCPEGVADKTKFVREKLTKGTWGSALFPVKEGDIVGAAGTGTVGTGTVAEPTRTFGFGLNTHHRHQTMGPYPHNLPAQHPHHSHPGFAQHSLPGFIHGHPGRSNAAIAATAPHHPAAAHAQPYPYSPADPLSSAQHHLPHPRNAGPAQTMCTAW